MNTEPYAILMFRNDLRNRAGEVPTNAGQWVLPGGPPDPGENPRQTAFRHFRTQTGVDLDDLEEPVVIVKALRSATHPLYACTYVGIGRDPFLRVLETLGNTDLCFPEFARMDGIAQATQHLGAPSPSQREVWPDWLQASFSALDDDQKQVAWQRMSDRHDWLETAIRALPLNIAFPERNADVDVSA